MQTGKTITRGVWARQRNARQSQPRRVVCRPENAAEWFIKDELIHRKTSVDHSNSSLIHKNEGKERFDPRSFAKF
jgi:hypothetical protein